MRPAGYVRSFELCYRSIAPTPRLLGVYLHTEVYPDLREIAQYIHEHLSMYLCNNSSLTECNTIYRRVTMSQPLFFLRVAQDVTPLEAHRVYAGCCCHIIGGVCFSGYDTAIPVLVSCPSGEGANAQQVAHCTAVSRTNSQQELVPVQKNSWK